MSTPTQTKNPPPDVHLAPGTLKMPDAALWANRPAAQSTANEPTPGTVLGFDYEKWACALIDLRDTPHRVEMQRKSLSDKGYVKLEGSAPIVVNFPFPEVWVQPREVFNARRAAKAERMAARVASGQLAPSATDRPKVDRFDPKSGASAQVA